MSVDKKNSAGASDDQTGAQPESLESSEIEATDLEKISGGGHLSLQIANSAECYTM